MSNINTINGKISVGVPGIQGDEGVRAPYDFYGDYTITSTSTFPKIEIINSEGTRIGYVHNPINNVPRTNDTIFYKTKTELLLYNVKSVINQSKVVVEKIDDFSPYFENTPTGTEDSSIDISVDIEVTGVPITYWRGDSVQKLSTTDSYVSPAIGHSSGIEPSIDFTIISNNGRKLYGYRVMLEFVTNYVSPGIDNITKDVFVHAGETHEVYHSTYEYATSFRGCSEDYSDKQVSEDDVIFPVIDLMNFDSENLENFYILLKDFDEGKDQTKFFKQVRLMRPPLKNRKYSCSVVIFVKTTSGFYEKRRLGELSFDSILNAV